MSTYPTREDLNKWLKEAMALADMPPGTPGRVQAQRIMAFAYALEKSESLNAEMAEKLEKAQRIIVSLMNCTSCGLPFTEPSSEWGCNQPENHANEENT